MGRIGVVIVDGVGYRNFILSDFIRTLQNENNEIIIFSGLKESIYNFPESSAIKIIELAIFREKKVTWIFRKMKELAHLQRNKHYFAIADNLRSGYPKNNNLRAFITKLLIKFTSRFNSENIISIANSLQTLSYKNDNVVRKYFLALKENKPDVLFFTHQRPPYLAPLDYAAKKLGIKTCSFIFSWDNLPSKGRMAAPFDSFLVWSELMKEELEYFYPETKNKPVNVVGTPQFEPYVLTEYESSKEQFLERFKIDENLKTICYSCGDVSTSKNDGLYIETIAQAIIRGNIQPVNLIVRTSPAEDGSRFKKIKNQFPFIIWNFPHWEITREDHPEPWSQRVPFKDDVTDLRALLEYCDLNVNMCSTMGLDFMIFDKPVINSVFGNGENGLNNDQKYLRYAHYQRVVESGAVAIAKDKEELIEAINYSLENPKSRLNEQQELLKIQIGKPLKDTSLRIVEGLRKLS